MTTHKEALTLALEALIGARAFLESDAPVEIWSLNDKAITAIKEALAQPEQEPTNLERHERNVQQLFGTPQLKEPEHDEYLSKAYRLANELRCHLAIAPAPQRTWVGLTDKEAHELWESTDSDDDWELMKRTEAKLKEKNMNIFLIKGNNNA